MADGVTHDDESVLGEKVHHFDGEFLLDPALLDDLYVIDCHLIIYLDHLVELLLKQYLKEYNGVKLEHSKQLLKHRFRHVRHKVALA